MKVLMFSTDKNIFMTGSETQRRMLEYGSLVEELHIVVKSQISNLPIGQIGLKSQRFGNVFIYSTNSRWPIFYIWDAYKIGKSIIRNLKFEIKNCVITCQDPFETGLVGYLIKRKFKIPLQIQVHTDFLSPYFYKESIKNKIRVTMGKWLIKKANGVRVVSERIKNSLLSLYPRPYTSSSLKTLQSLNNLNPIFVLPIFVDIEKSKNSPVKTDLHKKYPGRFIILMASRLTKEKNIGLAIEAMRGLTRKSARINAEKILLLIVGDGPEREALQLLTFNYQLSTNVIFEPWSDDLISYYKTADLFLLTSNYEGYGRTVVEATAASLPVVMTDVGVAVGSVVPVGDREALADRLELLISNRSEREKTLESQKKILEFYRSKEDYLNRIKQSWSHE